MIFCRELRPLQCGTPRPVARSPVRSVCPERARRGDRDRSGGVRGRPSCCLGGSDPPGQGPDQAGGSRYRRARDHPGRAGRPPGGPRRARPRGPPPDPRRDPDRAGEGMGRVRANRLLRFPAADRIGVPAGRGRAADARHRRRRGRRQRSEPAREPHRAKLQAPGRGVRGDPRTGRGAAALRGLRAVEHDLGQQPAPVDGAAAGAGRRPAGPVPGPGAPRLLACAERPRAPARARAAAAACDRVLRRRAQADRGRSPRRRRPAAGGRVAVAVGSRQRPRAGRARRRARRVRGGVGRDPPDDARTAHAAGRHLPADAPAVRIVDGRQRPGGAAARRRDADARAGPGQPRAPIRHRSAVLPGRRRRLCATPARTARRPRCRSASSATTTKRS